MTVTEAAKVAGVAPRTIYYNIKVGNIKTKKVESKMSGTGFYLEIDKKSFEAWLKTKGKK